MQCSLLPTHPCTRPECTPPPPTKNLATANGQRYWHTRYCRPAVYVLNSGTGTCAVWQLACAGQPIARVSEPLTGLFAQPDFTARPFVPPPVFLSTFDCLDSARHSRPRSPELAATLSHGYTL